VVRKVWWALLLVVTSSLALQEVSINDNEMKKLNIASNELSRIFVRGDRIQSVRGLDGAYLLTKDAVSGQIYVKPTGVKKDFNLYIGTEKGHNYNLLLSALELPGQDIELKGNSSKQEVEAWEQSSPYEQVVLKLVVGMITNSEELVALDAAKREESTVVKINGSETKIKGSLISTYQGGGLRGEVWQIENLSKKEIGLEPGIFYHTHVRAIALLAEKLVPNRPMMLYRVVN
jgi:type-F conjugative transfer system secretin TraK